MNQLPRKAVAVIVSAALTLGAIPPSALAEAPAKLASAPGMPASPSDARKLFEQAGISKANIDGYLISRNGGLSTLGRLLYRPMKERYGAQPGNALREEGKSLDDKLTALTVKNSGRAPVLTESSLREVSKQLGAIGAAYDPGDSESNYRRGVAIEALIAGGQPSGGKGSVGGTFFRRSDGTIRTDDGIFDKNGKPLVNFKLRQQQREWNRMKGRPEGAPMIPETGVPNRETLEFGYWQVKKGLDAQFEQMRLGRMRQLAALLGENEIMQDQFDAALEAKLENEARRKHYRHNGRETYVLDYVDRCWLEERQTLYEGLAAQARYWKDMKAVIARFRRHPPLTDADQKLLRDDQLAVQNRFRRAAIGSEMIQVDTLKNFLDPDQPDFDSYRKSLQAAMPAERVAALERTLRGTVKDWHEQTSVALRKTNAILDRGRRDPSPQSQTLQDAVTIAADKTYREFIAQVMPYHSALATVQGLRKQVSSEWWEAGEWGAKKAFAWVSGRNSAYALKSRDNERDWARMPRVLGALAAGNPAQARQMVIDLHPRSADKTAAAASSEITDAMRSDAAFKEIANNVNLVDRTNGYIKVGVTVAEYAVTIAAGGALIQAGVRLAAGLIGGGAIGAGTLIGRGIAGAARIFRGLEESGGLMVRFFRWPGFAIRETALHVASNFGLVQEAGAVVRASALRSVAATTAKLAIRQTQFLASSGLVMGSWESGKYLIARARGGTSPYSGPGAAFLSGAEGGVLFFGSGAMPLIMFLGIPATAFRGIPLISGFAQTLANHGALGLLKTGGQWAARGFLGTGTRFFEGIGAKGLAASWRAAEGSALLATPEELAKKGVFNKNIYERLGDAPIAGKFLSYVAMQADGMARFFGMNEIVKNSGFWYGYDQGQWSREKDFGQHLKGARATELNWQNSIWWAFLPQGSAHERAKNMDVYHAFEGGKEYEEKGRLSEILGADESARLPFLKPKPSWWTRLTNPYARPDTFQVNESLKDWARGRALLHELGGKNPEDVHFMELYRASRLQDADETDIGLRANAQLRNAAILGMIASMLAGKNLKTAEKFLDEDSVGREIDGYSLTPEAQEALAFSLLSAPLLIGRSAPRELVEKARAILARNVESAAEMEAPAARLTACVDALKSMWGAKGRGLEPALAEFQDLVARATRGDSTVGRDAARAMLRGFADHVLKKHALDPASAAALDAMVAYVDATYARFQYANHAGMVHARLVRTLTALGNQYKSENARLLIGSWRSAVDAWRKDRDDDAVADDPESEGGRSFPKMVEDFVAQAKSADLPKAEKEAFLEAAADMRGAPWVVRDDKQTNMTGWREEQLQGLVQILSGYALQRRAGASASRLYQLVTTGGGKTLIQFVGLLPLAESLFKRRGLKRLLYVTIPPLKAQAVNDFVAFKVAGTRLEFGTPEDVKADIAQGKLDGSDPMSKVMLIGDEADKFLFEDPQTSLGGRSGMITRLSSAFLGMDQRFAGLLGRLDQPRAERESRVSAAARRVLRLASPKESAQAEVRALRAARSESDVADALTALRRKIDPHEGSKLDRALRAAEEELGRAPVDGGFRSGFVAQLKGAFKKNLEDLGLFGREGADRLMRDSLASAVALRSELDALGEGPEFDDRRAALTKRMETFERFAPREDGLRLALLQDKIAEVSADRGGGPEPKGLRPWRDAAQALERGMNPVTRLSARDHASAVARYHKARKAVTALEDAISEAMIKDAPNRAALIKARLSALREKEKSRDEADRARLELTPSGSGLVKKDIRKLVKDLQKEIVKEAQGDAPGWESRVEGMIAAQREALKSYGGGENPVYSAFRAMQESMRAWAYDERLYRAGKDDPVVAQVLHALDGKSLWREWWPAMRMFRQAMFGRGIDPGRADVGLTRRHAAELLRAMRHLDPGMSESVKSELFWPLVGSLLWPRGGKSYVGKELGNQLAGFFEDPTGVYNNPRNGEVFARFNGQVIPNMDIRTRRYQELKAGADLTLPYEHLEVGGAEDLLSNPKANFFFFSATIEGDARKILADSGVRVSGAVVKPEETPLFLPIETSAERASLVLKTVARESVGRGDVALVRSQIPPRLAHEIDAYRAKKDAGAEKGLDDEEQILLENARLKIIEKQPAFVVNLKDPEFSASLTDMTRQWLLHHAPKRQKGLVTALCSDTKTIDEMEATIQRQRVSEGKRPLVIAKIYSDVQYEMANGDASQVEREMNLASLKSGEADLLLIDSSYVIRGIDLNFKGAREDFDPNDAELSFPGYNHVSALFFGAQKNTEMQIIQGIGRTAPRRVLPGVKRSFVVSVDIRMAQSEEAFRAMTSDPAYVALLRQTKATDWASLNAAVRRSGDKALIGRYNALIGAYLKRQWADVSKQKLSASGFSKAAPPVGRFPGVEAVVGVGQ